MRIDTPREHAGSQIAANPRSSDDRQARATEGAWPSPSAARARDPRRDGDADVEPRAGAEARRRSGASPLPRPDAAQVRADSAGDHGQGPGEAVSRGGEDAQRRSAAGPPARR